MNDKVREAFEAAWDSWGWSNKPVGFWDAEKGSYTDPAIQWAWQGYRAAQSPSQPLVEVQEPAGVVRLPPLPRPDITAFDEDNETWVRSYSDELLEEHARAAVALNAVAPVRGLPLTPAQIKHAIDRDPDALRHGQLTAFCQGVRFAEKSHGIKEPS